MDPATTTQLIVLGASVVGWFELFAHLEGKPHVNHRHRRTRRGTRHWHRNHR